MNKEPTYVIVGASLAGAAAAQTLREQGFDAFAIERLLDQAVEGARHLPLLAGQRADARLDGDA